jgi:hypothetical protein
MAVQPDKIHLVPNDENIAFLFPKEKGAAYMNYSKNCVTCHAINKIEETWVPELKSVSVILEQKSN